MEGRSMTDYTKLVEALRRCASVERCDGICEMNYGSTDCESRLELDAAAAIEELEKERDYYKQQYENRQRLIKSALGEEWT